MKINEVKEKYKDEWVLIEVTKLDYNMEPLEGNVLVHSRNRDDTYQAMKKTKWKDIAHFYTGEIPDEGYAVAFIWESIYLTKRKT